MHRRLICWSLVLLGGLGWGQGRAQVLGTDTLRWGTDLKGARQELLADGYRVWSIQDGVISSISLPEGAEQQVYGGRLLSAPEGLSQAYYVRYRKQGEGFVLHSLTVLDVREGPHVLQAEQRWADQRLFVCAASGLLLQLGKDAWTYRQRGAPVVSRGVFESVEAGSLRASKDGRWLSGQTESGEVVAFRSVKDGRIERIGRDQLTRLMTSGLDLDLPELPLDGLNAKASWASQMPRLPQAASLPIPGGSRLGGLGLPSFAGAGMTLPGDLASGLGFTSDLPLPKADAPSMAFLSLDSSRFQVPTAASLGEELPSLPEARSRLVESLQTWRTEATAEVRTQLSTERRRLGTMPSKDAEAGRARGASKPSESGISPQSLSTQSLAAEHSTTGVSGPLSQSASKRLPKARRLEKWVFGHGAGLDLSGEEPRAFASQLDQAEGSASISDTNGRLLLYSDGQRVWDGQQRLAENGEGLWGHASSTQGALFVPVPGSMTEYYLFVVDQSGYGGRSRGLSVSRVAVDIETRRARVLEKNRSLLPQAAEKLCGIQHPNGQDYWVLAHGLGTDAFYAYRITEDGIEEPVLSYTGSVHPMTGNGGVGQMKFSPDGQHVALAVNETWAVEVFTFDPWSGELGPATGLNADFAIAAPYGVEFSPSGRLVYVSSSSEGSLWQLDVATRSRVELDRVENSTCELGALQLAPDGRIYVATPDADALGQIEHPDRLGRMAGYQARAVSLSGRSSHGLPSSLAADLSRPEARFAWSGACAGLPTVFTDRSDAGATTHHWDFGDGATSDARHPAHSYPVPGTYTAILRAEWPDGRSDTSTQQVTVFALPDLSALPAAVPLTELGSGLSLASLAAQGYALAVDGKPVGEDLMASGLTTIGAHTLSATLGQCEVQHTLRVLPYSISPDTPYNAATTAPSSMTSRRWPVLVVPNILYGPSWPASSATTLRESQLGPSIHGPTLFPVWKLFWGVSLFFNPNPF